MFVSPCDICAKDCGACWQSASVPFDPRDLSVDIFLLRGRRDKGLFSRLSTDAADGDLTAYRGYIKARIWRRLCRARALERRRYTDSGGVCRAWRVRRKPAFRRVSVRAKVARGNTRAREKAARLFSAAHTHLPAYNALLNACRHDSNN